MSIKSIEGLTLSEVNRLRFFKTYLKGIVKYPPRRSKQLPKGIAIALTFIIKLRSESITEPIRYAPHPAIAHSFCVAFNRCTK
jgi:hypothetical protein